MVIVGQQMDNFKALANANDWPINPLRFLLLHVGPDALGKLVEETLLSCLFVN